MAFTVSKSRLIAAPFLLVVLLAGPPTRATAPSPTYLTVTLVNDADGTGTASLDPGEVAQFDATVTRTSDAQDRPTVMTLEYTIPTDSTISSFLGCDTISCQTNSDCLTGNLCSSGTCTPDPTQYTFDCQITNPYPYQASNDTFGTSVEASILVSRNTPTDASGNLIIPASCPTGTFGDVTVAVSSDATDLNPDNTASVSLVYNPWADVGVTATAPATASQGSTVEIDGTVSNLGPCLATNVVVSPQSNDPYGDMELTFKSANGALASCVQFDGSTAPLTSDENCNVGNLAVGQNLTFAKFYSVDSVNVPQSYTLRMSGYSVAAYTVYTATVQDPEADPNQANNTANVTIQVSQSSSGCNTADGASFLPLLGVALFWLSRKLRRSPAA